MECRVGLFTGTKRRKVCADVPEEAKRESCEIKKRSEFVVKFFWETKGTDRLNYQTWTCRHSEGTSKRSIESSHRSTYRQYPSVTIQWLGLTTNICQWNLAIGVVTGWKPPENECECKLHHLASWGRNELRDIAFGGKYDYWSSTYRKRCEYCFTGHPDNHSSLSESVVSERYRSDVNVSRGSVKLIFLNGRPKFVKHAVSQFRHSVAGGHLSGETPTWLQSRD